MGSNRFKEEKTGTDHYNKLIFTEPVPAMTGIANVPLSLTERLGDLWSSRSLFAHHNPNVDC